MRFGEVAERSKAHAWRACRGQKLLVSSNLTLSAIIPLQKQGFFIIGGKNVK